MQISLGITRGFFVWHKIKKVSFINMIRITKGQANTVILTLTERSTLSNPTYLFVFNNDETKGGVAFIATDISLHTDRYNQFTITEKVSGANPLNGECTLSPDGHWTYAIYEQESTINLNPDNATGVVETGKVKVVGTAASYTKYDDQPKTYTVYNP